ncbi:uncharacterized protein ARMOST_11470 [Armillaria ostoyae]|uniref:Uncharacterized protein n=1 Tax=Armillaria ostoyae TaxID=47428 RepID=A0A284RH97_ARMOS|nr:uncharacterized protein ARMOST_11470 [Armillaria ostoyae]
MPTTSPKFRESTGRDLISSGKTSLSLGVQEEFKLERKPDLSWYQLEMRKERVEDVQTTGDVLSMLKRASSMCVSYDSPPTRTSASISQPLMMGGAQWNSESESAASHVCLRGVLQVVVGRQRTAGQGHLMTTSIPRPRN